LATIDDENDKEEAMYVAIHTRDVLTTLTSVSTPTCTYC